MKIKQLLLLSIFLMSLTASFGQLDKKTRSKRLKTLKQKYNFISTISKCNTVLVGQKILGGNDGGGRVGLGFNNIEIISLLDKKLVPWTSPYKKSLSKNRNYKNEKDIYRIYDVNEKVGLLHACDRIILEPKYDEIGPFNKDGLAVASVGNKMDVINLKGESILDKPLNYTFLNTTNATTKRKDHTYPLVIENTIIVSNDNINFGLYNVIEKKEVTPLQYTFIDYKPFVKRENSRSSKFLGYLAYNDDKATLLNSTGKELVPKVFNTITKYLSVDGRFFAAGTLDNQKNGMRIIDVETSEYLLEENFITIKPIDSNNWIVEFDSDDKPLTVQYSQQYTKTGVYNIKEKKFIIPPNKNFKFRNVHHTYNYNKILNNAIRINVGNQVELHSIKTGSIIGKFSQPKFESIELEGNQEKNAFILISTQPKRTSSLRYSTLYDENWNPIFEHKRVRKKDIVDKKSFFYIKEKINCKPGPCEKVYTAYSNEGKLIGEEQKYTPKTE